MLSIKSHSSHQSGARTAAIVEFVDVMRELGEDPAPLLANEGLTLADLLDPERIVPTETVGRLIIAGAINTGFEHFGAMLATHRNIQSYLGTLGRLVWSAPNLGAALKEFTQYIEIHIAGSHWHLDVEGTLARLRNEFDQTQAQQGIEHNLVLVYRLIKALTLGAWSPSFVYMTIPAPQEGRYLRQLFDAPVLFDAPFNGIEFHASDLATPLSTADQQLSAILHGLVDANRVSGAYDLVEHVGRLVERNLITGVCSIDAVVKFLPYARSTLQRKLSEQMTSYQRILDDVRARRAQEALAQSNTTIGQLSDALGYASIDAFSHAFRKRFGVAPSQWRKAQVNLMRKNTES